MSDDMPERLRLIAYALPGAPLVYAVSAHLHNGTSYVRADKCGPTREQVEREIETAIHATLREVHRQKPIGGVVVKIDDMLAAALDALFPSDVKA